MGHDQRFPYVVQKLYRFLHFKGTDVQKLRKVLFLIVLNKGTYTSNATIVINASLCTVTRLTFEIQYVVNEHLIV